MTLLFSPDQKLSQHLGLVENRAKKGTFSNWIYVNLYEQTIIRHNDIV